MAGPEQVSLVATNPHHVKLINSEKKMGLSIELPLPKKNRGKPFRQILAALIANLGTINVGFAFGFSAVANPQLMSPDSVLRITKEQASWVASLSAATTPIGCLLGGYIMDRYGRKKVLLVTELPLVLGWLLISFASDVYMIYVGRLLVGLGAGMVGAPARVYTSEVTQPHLRGTLTGLASVGISFGVLLQYTFGAFCTWQVLSGLSAIIPILSIILMWFMPETPNFLIARQKQEKATKSLAQLRGSTYDVEREIKQLTHFANKNNNTVKLTTKETFSAMLQPGAFKPFLILLFYFMVYQFGGVNTVTFYAVEIFAETGSTMDKNTCTIMLGVVRLVFTIVAIISLRKFGRRFLTFVSSIGCGTSMIGLGAYFYCKAQWDAAVPKIEPMHTWVPITCIFVFTVTCTLGYLVVPWVMIGELYPQKVRGMMGGITTCSAHMFVFIVVKTYPFLTVAIERHGTYFMYGLISIVGTLFFYFALPETKGTTLHEIEDYFSGRTKTLGAAKATLLPTTDPSSATNNNLSSKFNGAQEKK